MERISVSEIVSASVVSAQENFIAVNTAYKIPNSEGYNSME
jgi:hypothetical protein